MCPSVNKNNIFFMFTILKYYYVPMKNGLIIYFYLYYNKKVSYTVFI